MAGARRVLLFGADAGLRAALAEQLEHGGAFAVEATGDAARALEAARTGRRDAIVLDAGPPDPGAPELCRRMRALGVAAPILVLAGAGAAGEKDAGACLDAGADERLAKPFRVAALRDRLRALRRRAPGGGGTAGAIGPWEFRRGARLLRDAGNGREVRLTEKEAAILERLRRAGGRAVPREVLLDEVWGYSAGAATHTLETHVWRLRRKIEADPSNAALLLTEAGGYRLAS